MEEHREEVLQAIIEELRSENRHETSAELVKRASNTVAGMAHVISYGFIKRISHSVGQRELTQAYRRVWEEEDSAAVALVDTSIKLDHTTEFPMHEITELNEKLEGNPFAASILRHLVINYFHLFPVPTGTKQQVCQKLKIPIGQANATLSNQRKIIG
jgi:hypothetical protein